MLLRDYRRLDSFLGGVHKQAGSFSYYDGVFVVNNRSVIEMGINFLGDVKGLKVLDVGVGLGHAYEMFSERGAIVKGITIDSEEYEKNALKGYDVLLMDMNFMSFDDNEFDIVWARHCVEHSIFPYYTLSEFYRITKNGGSIYMEVPAPDFNGHERNPNHYSIMSGIMWRQLLKRVGYECVSLDHIDFSRKDGTLHDRYFRLIGHKPKGD